MRLIAGMYKGRVLRTVSGPGYRPATGRVRESLFSTLESLGVFWPQTRVADIFAGSGSLALEALSRGALQVVFVEKSGQAAGCILDNLVQLGVERQRFTVCKTDALRWVACGTEAFDLVFIDPPYGQGLLAPTLYGLMKYTRLAPEGLVCTETELALDTRAMSIPGLRVFRDKIYGQTRITLWQNA